MKKAKMRELESLQRVWCVGIDPGLGTTAMVLTKKDVPIAAVAVNGRSSMTAPLINRCHDIAQFCVDYLETWMVNHDIDELFVMLESPILRTAPLGNNVKTLMSQCTLQGTLMEALHKLADEDARVFLALVNNKTAKATFTGDGEADKTAVIACSAWCKRPDVAPREHLADAQAIAGVYGEIAELEGACTLQPVYVDSTLGKGAQWRNKWPSNGRYKPWKAGR